MKDKIEIPRHKKYGITVTIVVDNGSENYVFKQNVISDRILEYVNFFDDYLLEVLKQNAYECIEYMKKEGFIKQQN